MKKSIVMMTLFSSVVLTNACTNNERPSNQNLTLSHCTIQETIPGAKATGAFLNIKKFDASPLALVAATAPDITKRVEIHEMLMKDNKMTMSQITSYSLQQGDNFFKKGGYHIMLMDMQKHLKAGESYPITLIFSDGSEKTCLAKVKTVRELTPQPMKKP